MNDFIDIGGGISIHRKKWTKNEARKFVNDLVDSGIISDKRIRDVKKYAQTTLTDFDKGLIQRNGVYNS